MSEHRDNYATSLDNLRILAQRDLLAWWKKTASLPFVDQRKLLLDPFHAIIVTYGEQAAYAAADYLFMERSFEDSLLRLEYPEVADPVGFAEARKSYRYAMWLKNLEDEHDRQMALRKLQGIMNRLVVQPARETVFNATIKAGTRYARVPEPGACPFCLMLASRGAVYAARTVGADHRKFHDNCRCLGIEVKSDAELPRINRDLAALWEHLGTEIQRTPELRDWQHMIAARREQATGEKMWPKLQYVRVPKYKGDGYSRVFPGEKLPDLDRMPGHVLHGWREKPAKDGTGVPHTEDLQQGHRWDTQRDGVTKFPREWSDQRIVDAVRDSVEAPDEVTRKNMLRLGYRIIDGVKIEFKYTILKDGSVVSLQAYPAKEGSTGS